VVVVCLAGVLGASPSAQNSPGPAGQPWDAAFRALPKSDNIEATMKRMSAHPHHVGSPFDKDNALWMVTQFKTWGWDAQLETFDVLFPTPKERVVELLAPTRFNARLEEPAVPEDPTSNQKDEQLPTYNAYSIDGDVTGPLVYVNYGRPEDYETLDRLGVSVRGAIVIARYGGAWRGIKPKVAGEHGAIGCLIYSDPKDDGFYGEPVFPDGPMRPKDGVQRGSVMDMPLYPGDPLTPGVGAVQGATRIPLANAPTLTKIPVQPISYGDAQPLLAAIKGPVAPAAWRGALPITYRLGPGLARVHLKVAFNWDTKTLYDVIAKIPGRTFPDEWIVRGNHHDAWVNGAEDPLSGTSVMLEEARVLGDLRKQGWQPKRTIVYTAWDGEEPALLGSTEWVETHMTDLQKHAVVYLNSDGNGRGVLSMAGSHSLEHFINDVAKAVSDPETGTSVWKRAQLTELSTATTAEARDKIRARADLHIGALGSGSDYSPFLQHAGIASLNLAFGGEDPDGIYHSVYDDYYFYTHFLDTDFSYEKALAQTMGTAVMRLADADVLPFEFTNLADTVQGYVDELEALLKQKQEAARDKNQDLVDGLFAAVNDPRRPVAPPKPEVVPPSINFAPLENAASALSESAKRFTETASGARAKLAGNNQALQVINQKLQQCEQQLTDTAGLPGRNWYRHMLYAPGFYTGYGVKTIPGVREGLEQGQYAQAESEAARVASAINRLAAAIDSITAEMLRAPVKK
jgi:N-acetylated-alpha-linked acidic dipeptidase